MPRLLVSPFRFALFLFFLLLSAGSPPALAKGLPVPVTQALKAAGIPESGVAVYVQDVQSERPVLTHQGDRPMNPASVMKLVTTYAALEQLGPGFRWKTEVYADGPLQGEVLDGNLILKGYGDPKLSLENFWLLLRKLRQTGLREVRGDLVLDARYFDPKNGDPGAFDQRPYRAYNVGPEALLVHYRVVALRLMPDLQTRQVRIVADPQPGALRIVNQLKLSGASCDDWRAGFTTEVQNGGTGVAVTLAGAFPAECGEKELLLAPFDTLRYTEGVFRQLWTEQGASLRGTARFGALPSTARLLYYQESPPLADVIRDINKFSNNVMARTLFLTLGAQAGALPATPEHAAAAVRAALAARGLDFPELVLENGSGLSRIERISARSLGALLATAHHSPYMPEFIASLPLSAVDGTLKKRLAAGPLAGRVHAKTGLLDEVKSLAGYVLDKRGHWVVVVFVVNDPKAGAAGAAQDALLRWVYEGGRG